MAEKIGKLIYKSELQTGVGKQSGRSWQKMTFVIQLKGETRPKKVAFDTFNSGVISFVNDTSIDTDLKVEYDVESREYQGKWYSNINATSVEVCREEDTPINRELSPNVKMPDYDDGNDLPF